MKLRKLIKFCDPTFPIKIFANDEDETEPIYEGMIFDIPWWITNLKIPEHMFSGDEPIHTWYQENPNGNIEGVLIVTVDL